MDQLSEESLNALSIFEKNNVPLLPMSAITDEGVMEVKQQVIFNSIFLLSFIVYKTIKKKVFINPAAKITSMNFCHADS